MQDHVGTVVCKIGGDRVMCVVEVATCVYKFTDSDRPEDDGRLAIA